MRILWLSSLDRGVFWNQNFFHERLAFGRQHNLVPWGPGFPSFPTPPRELGLFDLVVLSETWLQPEIPAEIEHLGRIKLALLVDNYPQRIPSKVEQWRRAGVQIVLYRYQTGIAAWKAALPNLEFWWHPWGVDPEVYAPGKQTYDVALLGSRHEGLYPTRARLHRLLGTAPFRYLTAPHYPGFRFGVSRHPFAVNGADYAQLLASAAIGIATGGKPGYAVGKYFEILAVGSCLVGTWVDDLGELGFLDGENMIVLREKDPIVQLCELLRDPGRVQEIAVAGRALAQRRHTWDNRVAAVNQRLRAYEPRCC